MAVSLPRTRDARVKLLRSARSGLDLFKTLFIFLGVARLTPGRYRLRRDGVDRTPPSVPNKFILALVAARSLQATAPIESPSHSQLARRRPLRRRADKKFFLTRIRTNFHSVYHK